MMMLRYIRRLAIAVLVWIVCLIPTLAEAATPSPFPKPSGYISDYAHMITDGVKGELDEFISTIEASTGAQIAVVTIPTLSGEDIESVATRLFAQWGIGQSKNDTGVLLLISRDDRKIRIETGYGVEPLIPDAVAGDIIRNDIAPYFKADNYDEGIAAAVRSIAKRLSGDSTTLQGPPKKSNDFDIFSTLIGIGVLLSYLGAFLGRTKAIWPGGAIGAVTGLVVGLLGSGLLLTGLALGIGLGILGFIIDAIVSSNYQYRKSHGLSTDFWHSGGGFSHRSGGGFGGFGGGRSGGGGASGGW